MYVSVPVCKACLMYFLSLSDFKLCGRIKRERNDRLNSQYIVTVWSVGAGMAD